MSMVGEMFEGPTMIIAEMANAHEGELWRAKDIVDAVSTDANAIKFQIFTADELALPSHPAYGEFDELAMGYAEWAELIGYAHDAGLSVFTDVFGHDSIELVAECDVDGVKVHNADVSNTPLLREVEELGKPVLLSSGGSTWIELAKALDQLSACPVLLMYGFQNYPTDLADSNLYKIQRLREQFQRPVGYASHVDGGTPMAVEMPALAVAAGADAVEVHVTLDRDERGTDYVSSLEPAAFGEMVERVRSVERVTGDRTLRLSPSEREYRRGHKKWLVATEPLEPGDKITEQNVGYKRLADPEFDKSADIRSVLGKSVTNPISRGEIIRPDHLTMKLAATLACRAESTRLYGKPMQMVGDRPILKHLVDRLNRAERIDEIVLAIADTPSQSIFVDFAHQHGLSYVIGSEPDVLARLIAAGDEAEADHIARVTTENPYIYEENLDELIAAHLEEDADLTTTRRLPLGSTVEIVDLDALKHAHEYGEDRHRSELCTLFLVENPDSFRIQTVDPPGDLRRPDIRLTVDNPEDLILVRDVWDNLDDGERLPALRGVIAYLDENPSAIGINEQYADGTDEDVKSVRPFMYGDES